MTISLINNIDNKICCWFICCSTDHVFLIQHATQQAEWCCCIVSVVGQRQTTWWSNNFLASAAGWWWWWWWTVVTMILNDLPSYANAEIRIIQYILLSYSTPLMVFHIFTLRDKLSGTVYCNQSCLWVCLCVCLWVCYHVNSKLRASILTKLGL